MQPAPALNSCRSGFRSGRQVASHASWFAVGVAGLGAVGAYAPHQPLRDDPVHGGGDHVPRRTHVEQAVDGRDRVDGVQRRKYQVAGHRTAQPDLDRLAVAHFADQDDVGILAQRRAQNSREIQTDLRHHLHLRDAVEAVFDRVFDGDHFHARLVDVS